MYRCNHCYHVTDESVKVCPRCGKFLANNTLEKMTRILAARPTTSRLQHRAHVGKLTPNDTAFYLSGLEGPLVINLSNELVFGRSSRTIRESAVEAFDLAPFQAIERGVSRAHLALRRYNRSIMVVDLDSTNGSWLNSYRLQPNVPVVIANGDKLTLAKLSMHVYFE